VVAEAPGGAAGQVLRPRAQLAGQVLRPRAQLAGQVLRPRAQLALRLLAPARTMAPEQAPRADVERAERAQGPAVLELAAAIR
jgi:hypothetical protein